MELVQPQPAVPIPRALSANVWGRRCHPPCYHTCAELSRVTWQTLDAKVHRAVQAAGFAGTALRAVSPNSPDEPTSAKVIRKAGPPVPVSVFGKKSSCDRVYLMATNNQKRSIELNSDDAEISKPEEGRRQNPCHFHVFS